MLLTSINAGTDYLKIIIWLFEIWIRSQSARGHKIEICISARNFTLQLLLPATENLSNFRWIIILVWRYEGTYIEWTVTKISYQALKLTAHYLCNNENMNLKLEKIKRIQFST